MSVRDYLLGADRALLKPYSGASASLLQRCAPFIVAGLAAILCLPYGFFYALTTPWLLVPFVVPLAVLLMIAIWAAPASPTVPVQTMERLFFALFIAFVMWPNYLAISLPGLPWITVSRLIGTPLVLIFLVSLSSNVEFRGKLGLIVNVAPVFWKGLALLIALEIVSLPFSKHFGETISRIFVVQTTETAPFLLGTYMFVRPGRATYAVYAFWLMAVAVSLIGLLEAPQQHALWAGHIPGFLKVGSETVARILTGAVRGTTGQYRIQSVFSTPLGLSEFLGFTSPFVLHLALSRGSKLFVRLAATGTLPLMLFLILGTDSRLGLLAAFLSAMLYLLFWALVHRRRRHGLLGTAVVIAYPALFSVGVVASMVVGKIRAKVWGTGQYDDSTQARYDQFNLALPKMLTHPLGHGMGMGAEAIGYHAPNGMLTVDSYYLSLTMELGIFGLVAFLGMFSYLAIRALLVAMKSYDEDGELSFLLPASISLFVFLIVKMVFAQEDNHPIIFVIAGMIVALLYRNKVRENPGLTAEGALN
jgi:hypothetical protein